MTKAVVGKTYVQIVSGRCHKVFTIADLPEWNPTDIQVVELTGAIPLEGYVHNGGDSFSPYVPPPLTQTQINEAADAAAMKAATDALPAMLDVLTKLASGADKTALKVFDDKVKAEQAKKV